MIIELDRTGSVENFRETLSRVVAAPQVKSVLVLASDTNGFTPAAVDATLQNCPVPIFGGIFPALIYGREKLDRGTIIVGLPVAADLHIVPRLSDTSVDYEEILDREIPEFSTAGMVGRYTMFVFVDGLAARISALIDSLFNLFGLEINYLGGGAGSLSFERKPCLFSNQGLLQDSAVLAVTMLKSGIGVSHGWTSIKGPIKVTEAAGNVIKTLNWQPAFDVYRQVVEAESGRSFTATNFFEIAKGYPFGINRLGAEKIVRDPIQKEDDGSLVCVGEVPAGTFVDILAGTTESLVDAACQALHRSLTAIGPALESRLTIFVDCISRVLFLQDEFGRELDAVHTEEIPLIGALTMGEIANSGQEYLEFYNKTAVVGIVE
jgi:hypothetical protein